MADPQIWPKNLPVEARPLSLPVQSSVRHLWEEERHPMQANSKSWASPLIRKYEEELREFERIKKRRFGKLKEKGRL